MKLDKLILVNWGALRSQEYPMGGMTLLTGPTGSGKSTMLDALQTVMTAVYQNIFNYNPGQDETTQGARNGPSAPCGPISSARKTTCSRGPTARMVMLPRCSGPARARRVASSPR